MMARSTVKSSACKDLFMAHVYIKIISFTALIKPVLREGDADMFQWMTVNDILQRPFSVFVSSPVNWK